MAKTEGKAFRIFLDSTNNGTPEILGLTKSDNLSMSKETKENSHKDSGGWAENTHGKKSWNIQSEGFHENSDGGFAKIQDSFDNDKDVWVELRDSQNRIARKGWAIVSSLNLSNGDEDPTGLSITLTGNGALESSTY